MGIVVGHEPNIGAYGYAALAGAQGVTTRENLMWAYQQRAQQAQQAAQNALAGQQIAANTANHQASIQAGLAQNEQDNAARIYSQQLGLQGDQQQQKFQAQQQDDQQQFQQDQLEQRQSFDADQKQRAQESMLVKAGKLRYTPQQKQQMSQVQDAMSRLASDQTMSEYDRAKGMNMLQGQLRAIRPQPVPDDEQPPSPQEAFQQQVIAAPDPATGIKRTWTRDRNGVWKAIDDPDAEQMASNHPWPSGQGVGDVWQHEQVPGLFLTRDPDGKVRQFTLPKTPEAKPQTMREKVQADPEARNRLLDQAEKNVREKIKNSTEEGENTREPKSQEIHDEAERILSREDKWLESHGGGQLAAPAAASAVKSGTFGVPEVDAAFSELGGGDPLKLPMGIISESMRQYSSEAAMPQRQQEIYKHAVVALHDSLAQAGESPAAVALRKKLVEFRGDNGQRSGQHTAAVVAASVTPREPTAAPAAQPAAPSQPAAQSAAMRAAMDHLPRPTTKAEYEKLRPGATYVYTDGSVRTKPGGLDLTRSVPGTNLAMTQAEIDALPPGTRYFDGYQYRVKE